MVDVLQLEFQARDDNHGDGKFIFNAGADRCVRFNPCSIGRFWLGAYVAREGFSATQVLAGQRTCRCHRPRSPIKAGKVGHGQVCARQHLFVRVGMLGKWPTITNG